MAKRQLGLLEAARDDLKITLEMVGPGHRDKGQLNEEMNLVRRGAKADNGVMNE
jgi:hypothetical protein